MSGKQSDERRPRRQMPPAVPGPPLKRPRRFATFGTGVPPAGMVVDCTTFGSTARIRTAEDAASYVQNASLSDHLDTIGFRTPLPRFLSEADTLVVP
jgi:hypothetical protein